MDYKLLPQSQLDLVKPKPGVSSFVKGGLGLLVTSLVDMVVAFSTAYWATWSQRGRDQAGVAVVHYGGYGLWKMWRCEVIEDDVHTDEELHRKMTTFNEDDTSSWCSVRMADLKYPGWYVSVQVLETLGLAGLLTSLILLLLYVFLPQWHGSKKAMSSIIAISYLSGLFIIVGVGVFGFKVAEDIEVQGRDDWFLSWSFSLACTAFVLDQIAASILITENKRLYKLDQDQTQAKAAKDELEEVLRHSST